MSMKNNATWLMYAKVVNKPPKCAACGILLNSKPALHNPHDTKKGVDYYTLDDLLDLVEDLEEATRGSNPSLPKNPTGSGDFYDTYGGTIYVPDPFAW